MKIYKLAIGKQIQKDAKISRQIAVIQIDADAAQAYNSTMNAIFR